MTRPDSATVSALRELYLNDVTAKIVLELFAQRSNKSKNITIDDLLPAVHKKSPVTTRNEVIAVFKQLADAGCGKFLAGRKGHKSRFEGMFSLIEVGAAAIGGNVSLEEPTTQGLADSTADSASTNLVQHQYRLRKDLELRIALPTDLSTGEAVRIADFIRTLPLN